MIYNLTITSNKFPGVTAYCPTRPIPGGGRGTFEFKSGITYPVDEPTLAAVQQHVAAQEPYIKNHIHITAVPIGGAGITAKVVRGETVQPLRAKPQAVPPATQPAAAVALDTSTEQNIDPLQPVTVTDEELSELEQEIVDDLAELTGDDEDLIEVEISKLHGLTIAQAEPIILNVATNPSFPLLVKRTYLERVSSDTSFQKGLREMATKTLEQIAPDPNQ